MQSRGMRGLRRGIGLVLLLASGIVITAEVATITPRRGELPPASGTARVSPVTG